VPLVGGGGGGGLVGVLEGRCEGVLPHPAHRIRVLCESRRPRIRQRTPYLGK
jgi:hypothetical protein